MRTRAIASECIPTERAGAEVGRANAAESLLRGVPQEGIGGPARWPHFRR